LIGWLGHPDSAASSPDLLALGGALVTSAIAAAVGAAVVLFAWRIDK
jgi:hypothetical protein